MHPRKWHLGWLYLAGLTALAPNVPTLQAQTGPATITLAATPSPAVAQPGVTVLTLVASNLPAGTIAPANLSVTLQVASGATGPNLAAQVRGYAAIPGSGGRITFQVLGPNVTNPTPYSVSVSGITSTGVAFSSSKPAALTINPPARILSITPSPAQPGQAIQVSITGQYTNYVQGSTTANFGPGISVGGAAVGQLGPLTVTSPTTAVAQLNIDTSAAGGPRTVTVATGIQQASLAAGFSVTGFPSLLSVSPNSGQQGQTSLAVTITGSFTHFSTSSVVTFSGTGVTAGAPTAATATSLTVPVSIAGTAPPNARDIQVVTGAETVSLANAFTVLVTDLPVITQVIPSGGQQGQTSLSVTITGRFTHFSSGSVVTFSGTGITAGAPTAATLSSLTLPVTIAANALLGAQGIQVVTGAETVSLANAFTVVAGTPAITLLNPNTGQRGQTNLAVTISGNFTHFTTGSVVTFSGAGVTAGVPSAATGSSLTVPVTIAANAALGTQGVQVVSGSETVSLANAFTVTAGSPVITQVSPNSGQQGQTNLAVTVSGNFTHFTTGSVVTFSGAGVTAGVPSAATGSSLTVPVTIVGNAPLGAQGIQVVSGSETVSLANAFTVTASSPVITLVNPNTGQQGQTNLAVTITGQYTHWMQATTTASFGPGIAVASLTVNSATSATAVLNIDPAAAIGARNVTLSAGAETATINGGFQVSLAANQPPIVSAGANQTITLTSDLFVAGENTSNVIRFNGTTGALIDVFVPTGSGGLYFDNDMVIGPDGNLYVTSQPGSGGAVLRYSGTDGSFLDAFVPSGRGGLRAPTALIFGPDGNLYVSDFTGQNVKRYNGSTGAFLGIFTSGGNPSRPQGLKFGVDGNLYLSDELQVLRYDGSTGAYMGVFVTAGSGGLQEPFVIEFGPDGNLYVSDWVGHAVRRYSSATGAFIDSFVASGSGGLNLASGIAFGPDGNLYVGDSAGGQILRYNGRTGAFLNVFVPAGTGGLTGSPEALSYLHFQNSASVVLNGSFSDDGLPTGSTLTATWTKLSGPGPVTFSNPTVSTPNVPGQMNAAATSAGFTIPGTYQLQLSASDSQSSSLSVVTVTVNPPLPSLISATPNVGPQGQQNLAVTITGQFTHFAQGTTTASFGAGITVASLTVNSTTSATAVLSIDPAAAAGARTVTVTTGAEIVTLTGAFTVTSGTPVLTTVNPNTGQQGQTSLAINLSGQFTHWAQGASLATFGAGITVTVLTVNSATGATATLNIDPSAVTGVRNVSVTTGTEVVTLTNAFTVTAGTPVLTTVNPSSGPQGQQSLPVNLTGQFTHWAQGTAAASFGAGITVATLSVSSSTSATAILNIDPAAATGARDVTMTTGTEVVTLNNAFTVMNASPVLTTVSPNTGQQGQQNLSVTITGEFTHFVQGTSVVSLGGGITVNSITVTTPTILSANASISVNAAVGARAVTITTGSESASLLSGFTVLAGSPTLLTVSPNTGEQGSQQIVVQITGTFTNFVQGVTQANFGDGVSVGGGPLGGFGPISILSDTTATATISICICALSGPRTVRVQTGGSVAALVNGFSITSGTQWSRTVLTGAPPRRDCYSSVFDPGSNRLVVFGGDGPSILNDVWTLTNANGTGGLPVWSQLHPSGVQPAPRRCHSAVYDAATNRMIVFGGNPVNASIPTLNDVWVLTNANGLGGTPQWINIAPQGQLPLPRRGASVGYDPANNRMTVFGGWTDTLNPLNDTWVLANANGLGGTPAWTQLAPAGLLPGARSFSHAAYDPGANRLTIYGGISTQQGCLSGQADFTDLWTLTNANGIGGTPSWIRLIPNGIAGSPSTTGEGGTAYNLGNNRMIITGAGANSSGRAGCGITHETWLLINANGLGGQPAWVQLQNLVLPTPPVSVGASYDSSTDRVIRFGDNTSNDTFLLKNATNVPVANPTPRLISVNPNIGQAGQSSSVTLTAECTSFSQGATQASFGSGISVGGGLANSFGPITATSPTAATAQLVVAGSAALGQRTVTVQTGAEQVLLPNVFTVLVAGPTVTVTPNSGPPGQSSLSVSLSGQFTHWVQGTSTASFGSGITVASLTVNSSLSATVVLNIDSAAATGSRTVTITTGAEGVVLPSGFTVLPGAPAILSVTPTTGLQGQQNLPVSITGLSTHFVSGTTLVSFGADITINSVSVTNPTSLTAQISIACGAALGPRPVIVTTGSEVASSSNVFTVTNLATSGDLLVAKIGVGAGVVRFDSFGTLLGYFVPPGSGGLVTPGNPLFGPDGNLYVPDFPGKAVRRYCGTSGTFIDDFVPSVAGGLTGPVAATFGPDGNLYVADYLGSGTGVVRRYSGTTGASMGVFTSGGSLVLPDGLVFGPDGNLYVSDEVNVSKFNGSTGAFIATFVPANRGGLSGPGPLLFGSDGNLYVSSANTGVLRYNGTTGAFISPPFVPSPGGRADGGLVFGPDGNLYVAYFHNQQPIDSVLRYNGQTGAPIDTFIPAGVIGIVGGIVFRPTPALLTLNPNTGQQGQQNLSVMVTGQLTHFTNTSAIDLGAGITVGSAAATDASHLTALVTIATNASVGTRSLTVTTGSEVVTLANSFTVTTLPTITTVSPVAGQQGQNGPIGVLGLSTHFVQGTSVLDLGPGIIVSSVAVTCSTCLSAQVVIADTATTGPRNVTVTTGAEVATLANGFTVQPGSAILTSLVPASGRQGQSFSVTMTGKFTHWAQGMTQVSLGAGITVTSVTVSSATSLSVQLSIDPAAAVGTRALTVTTGTEVVSAANVFTVQAATPILYTLSPGGGLPGQQNLSVVITGLATHFAQGTSVATFGAGVTVASLTVASATSATAVVNIDPAAVPGTRTVTVTTGSEAALFTNGFTVTASGPIISSLDPGGSSQGATNLQVQITGLNTHFVQGISVATFGAGITVTSLAVTNATTAMATVNIDVAATIGPRTVTVTTGTEVASFVNGFTVVKGVAGITQINPGGGPQGIQNLSLAVTAQFMHFVQGTTTATFGAGVTVVSLTINTPLTATAVVNVDPAAAVGARDVTFTTGTEVVTAPGGFTVSTGIPLLQSASPNVGQQGQQNLPVKITGQLTHFVQGSTTVSFGSGITVGTVTVASATSLTAQISIAANAAVGLRNVVVTTGAEQVSLTNGFTVQLSTNQPPVITIAPTWSVTLPSRLLITYTVTDDGRPAGGALTVSWDRISGPGEHGFTDQTLTSISVGFSASGTYVLRITATDTQFTVYQDVTVTVTGTPQAPPDVAITSPTEGQEITTFTDVIGTANTTDLKSWTLEMRSVDDSLFRPFATGTAPVVNAKLGVFDPTLLVNGIFEIRLKATDNSGQTSTTNPVTVVLTKNLKIGYFTVSFKDYESAEVGLPIQIIRTYDSRDLALGDFGPGWKLDIRTLRVRDNGTMGQSWQGTSTGGIFPTYCIQPTKAHIVTVSAADSTVYRFQPTLSPQCQSLVPIDQTTLSFSQVSGPKASLSLIGDNLVNVIGSWPGPMDLYDSSLVNILDVERYRLTLPDGRALEVSRAAGLEKMTDLNSNSLTITPAGIFHSNGRSITFVRDPLLGRINQVTDPAGNTMTYGYDLRGDLATFTDQAGNTSTYTYDSSHLLQKITDPRGIEPIRNDYDASGRLIGQQDAFGNVISYTHDFANHREIITDRLGHQTVNEYDADGNVVKVTDPLGGITSREYDARDNMTREINPLGKVRQYTYDANDNRISERDPLGNITSYEYNALNQVTKITDPLGRVTQNTYDAKGNLTSSRDALGSVTSYTYDGMGLRTSTTDPLGGMTTYSYDGLGRLTQQTDALSNTSTFTYDANGNRKSETRARTTASGPETLVTSYDYDALNRLTKTTFPDGSTSLIAYNAIGKQSETTDQLGRKTTYAYDAMGRLIRTSFPDGTNEQSEYDAEGRRTRSIDRASRAASYEYDALGRQTKATLADGATQTTVYDAAGQVLSTMDARGNATGYEYDDAGHRTKVTDALNQLTAFTYDAAGNQKSMTDANGNTTQFEYDSLNRRTRVTYPDASTDQTVYDALGRTTGKTDQAGRTTQYGYDRLGRLTQVTDARSQVTQYTYDEVGNRLTQTDANGHTTRFEYDRLGRRVERTLPLSMFETTTYDAAGSMKTRTDFNGRTTTFNYDTLNRLLSKTPDSTFAAAPVTFVYSSTGQRTQMVDPSGTTTYQYDSRDRLAQKATPQGTLTYSYDLQGDLAGIRSSNIGGTSVDYTYDQLNRLSTVGDNRLALGTTTYSYDNAGSLKSFTYPNNVTHTYSSNTLNRLMNLAVANSTTALASYAYTLGPAGNRTKVVELGGRTVDYTYDELYRLTGETITGGSVNGAIGYGYDPVGNRLQRSSTVAPVPPQTLTYDANDRLLSDTYDDNGNTTASGGTGYTYDFENHLLTKNGTEVSIVYDGDGNRVAKTVGGVTTRYLVDDKNHTGYAQVLEEIVGGTVQRVYTYGLNRISQSQASGTSFYGYDGHGNVRMLTDATGAVTDRYDYDAFGNVVSQTGTTSNVYFYSGEQLDPNLGSYYLRARYLSQSTGRFQTADPLLDLPFTLEAQDAYEYASSDPTDRSDPSGLYSLADATSVIAIMPVLALPSLIGTRGVTSVLEKALGTEETPIHAFHYLNFNKLTGVVSLFGLIPVTQTNDCVPLVGKNECAFFTPTPFFGAAEAKNQLQLPSLPDHVISLNLFKQKDQVSNTRNASGHPEWGSGGGLEFATPYGVFLYEPNRNALFSTIH